MSQAYEPNDILNQLRLELIELNDSIQFWTRPGAVAGAISMGGEIKDGTAAHVEDLRASVVRVEAMIAEIEAAHG